jgi:hypothetical protein
MSEPHDQELEDHLAGKSEVSRLYRTAPAEEPPPALDARIKAAARVGLTLRRPRWMLSLSVAAVLMLSISVLLRMQQEGVSPIPTEEAVPAPAATFQAPVESAPASIESEARSSAAPAPRAENPVPESRSRESRDSVAEPFPAAPAEAPAPVQRKSAPQRTDEATGAQNRDKSESLMSAPPAVDDAARMEQSAPLREPADWVEHIRRLRTEGRKPEAAAELQAFRERYPDYPLPEDLRSEP